jgi:hypothetical protein
MILDILEVHWETFMVWLASQAAIPCNDNEGPRNPYEGWGP